MLVHEKRPSSLKRRAPMIREPSEKQLSLPGFETPFEQSLDSNNRWVKLAAVIPWAGFQEA